MWVSGRQARRILRKKVATQLRIPYPKHGESWCWCIPAPTVDSHLGGHTLLFFPSLQGRVGSIGRANCRQGRELSAAGWTGSLEVEHLLQFASIYDPMRPSASLLSHAPYSWHVFLKDLCFLLVNFLSLWQSTWENKGRRVFLGSHLSPWLAGSIPVDLKQN